MPRLPMSICCLIVAWALAPAVTGASRQDAASRQTPATGARTPILEPPQDDMVAPEVAAARVDRLRELAERAADVQSRVTLRLACANLILSAQIEPPLTRYLLRIAPADAAGELAPSCDAALQVLNEAEELIDSLTPAEREQAWVDESRHVLRTLRIVADGARALALAEQLSLTARERGEVRAMIAILMEHADEHVKAVATLLDLGLRTPDDDRQRLLRRLPMALEPPLSAQLPHGFFLRLERCRLVAERGAHATAVAMLLQLEERSHQWFDDDRQEVAAGTAALVRLQVLEAWNASLDSAGGTESERQWCQSQADQLRSTLDSSDAGWTVLRLRRVIPLLAEIPAEAASGLP